MKGLVPTTIKEYRAYVREKFMQGYRGKNCEICGSTYKTCGHHVIPTGRCIHHCVSPENMIVLCPRHHTMGGDIAAHSLSAIVMDRFIEWMKANKPEQWAWAKEHERDNGKIRWQDLYEDLIAETGGCKCLIQNGK